MDHLYIYIYIYIYVLKSSPEAHSIIIPIPDTKCPSEDDPDLDDYYGYLQFINYGKNDSLYQNGISEYIENFKIKLETLKRLKIIGD